MNLKRVIFKLRYVILIVLIIAAILVFNHFSNKLAYYQEMNISYRVSDKIGLNLDNDSLKFGSILQGGFAERNVRIVNPFDKRVLVFINANDKWVNISLDRFNLNPGESKKLAVRVDVPENAEFGNYTGIFRVVMSDAWILYNKQPRK